MDYYSGKVYANMFDLLNAKDIVNGVIVEIVASTVLAVVGRIFIADKRKRRIIIILLLFFAAIGLLLYIGENKSTCKIELGDYVKLGKYNDESILWRCVAFYKINDGDQVIISDSKECNEEGYLPLMLSDKILCMKCYDSAGTDLTGSHDRGMYYDKDTGHPVCYDTNLYWRFLCGSNHWGDSNIRCWLNSNHTNGNVVYNCGNPPNKQNVWNGYNAYDNEAGFLNCFTQDELDCIKPIIQPSVIFRYEYVNSIDYDEMNNYGSKNHVYVMEISSVIQNANTTAYREYIEDTIFLMDVNQVHEVYMNGNILGMDYYVGEPTKKCIIQSEYSGNNSVDSIKWSYWLRTPYDSDFCNGSDVRVVTSKGSIGISGGADISEHGVRPAFYLNTSNTVWKCGNGSINKPYTIE